MDIKNCTAWLGRSLALIAIGGAALLGQTASGIRGVVAPDARPELVQEGFTFTEGPVGTADGGLYFSDIMGADKTFRLDSTARYRYTGARPTGRMGLPFSAME